MKTKQDIFLYHLLMKGKDEKITPKEMHEKIGGSKNSIYGLARNLENRALIKKETIIEKGIGYKKPPIKRVTYKLNKNKMEQIRRIVKDG